MHLRTAAAILLAKAFFLGVQPERLFCDRTSVARRDDEGGGGGEAITHGRSVTAPGATSRKDGPTAHSKEVRVSVSQQKVCFEHTTHTAVRAVKAAGAGAR